MTIFVVVTTPGCMEMEGLFIGEQGCLLGRGHEKDYDYHHGDNCGHVCTK